MPADPVTPSEPTANGSDSSAEGTGPTARSAVAGGFRGDLGKAPNLITIARLLLATVLFGLIAITDLWWTATVLFVVAVATDAVDGYVARRFDLITKLGRILDPFADKYIICGTFVFLLERGTETTGVAGWMVVIIFAREMLITSVRSFLEREGIDFSASSIGKWKMILQCVAITVCLASLTGVFHRPDIILIRTWLLWLTVFVTAYSGVIYMIRADRLLRTAASI